MVAFDELVMDLCLAEAWRYQGLTYPNPAVGAAVVKNGRILSIAAHKRAGGPHAEVEAIKDAYYMLTQDEKILACTEADALHAYLQRHCGDLFYDATIYVTLEPCAHFGKTPPCMLLLHSLGFKRIVIGTRDPHAKASGGASYLRSRGVEVHLGIRQKECEDLIEPFVRWMHERFIFFKFAQTLNGNITQGTISSLASRKFVHALRDRIDLLVIGGNTVRLDRPILDARLVQGRAPDVLIYTRKKDFDTHIPLFNIPHRKVYQEDTLDRLQDYRFIMIEGGESMLRATKDIVDWYLVFLAPMSRNGCNYAFDASMEFLHHTKIDRDLVIWSRNG